MSGEKNCGFITVITKKANVDLVVYATMRWDKLYVVIAEPWNWVMSWVDMLPHSSLVTLLEKHFFPRWLQVLGTWLSGPNPNYYEVTSWYQGWKTLFPQQLLSDSTVKGITNVYLCDLDSGINYVSYFLGIIPDFLFVITDGQQLTISTIVNYE